MEKKERKFKNGFELPFGKEARCGNYKVLRFSKALSKREMNKLHDIEGIPDEVRKILNRGSLPFIKISTLSGSWSVEICISLKMYYAILDIPVARDAEGRLWYYGEGEKAFYNLLNSWFAHTTTVGDQEYRADMISSTVRYINRATGKPLSGDEAKDLGKIISQDISTFTEATKAIAPDSDKYEDELRTLIYALQKHLNKLTIKVDHTTPSTDEEADKIISEMEEDENQKKVIGEIIDEVKKRTK